jgi:NADPH:quinone reductase-like Zn-dependent oxidoreductase
MRAYILESLDRAPAIVDIPEPSVGDDEVLVRVQAASVNPIDEEIATGGVSDWMDYEFPVTLGRDLAGSVERVGPGVTRFRVGDPVFGYIAKPVAHDGSFAEYVVVPEDQFIVHRPEGVDAQQAGAFGLASVTALMCIEATGVAAGDIVLINGATGGVGSYAIQIAKARGVHVIASARPGDEEEHVRALGADEAVDWSAGDLVGVVRGTHPDGIHGLVDVVTPTPEAFAELANGILGPGGRTATTRGVGDPEMLGEIENTNVFSMPDTGLMAQIGELAGMGKLRAPVAEVHDFERIEDAFAALSRGAVGKIGIAFGDGS